MFRNRNNTQKPDDELINRFQRTFAGIVPGPTNNVSLYNQSPTGPITPARLGMEGSMKFDENTPHTAQMAQTFIDPNALTFMNPLHQAQGYYTPNSGGIGAAYHNQAGDLHTPTMGLNMMTPLSLPQQIVGAPITTDGPGIPLNQFDQNFMAPQFQNQHPYAPAQPSFAPAAFMHRDSGYDGMDESEEISLNDMDMQRNLSPHMGGPSSMQDASYGLEFQNPAEKFRYHVTLRAPTAMVRDKSEIPVSYLNKGQAYSVFVTDTAPPSATTQPVRYRTFIRVSFQEEEQRKKPAACWQLWKEGRGTNEAHQRGGKLQAVEYVDPIQGGSEEHKNRQIQVESSSFDGFCVTWTANPAMGSSNCAISVRFNFLSTDFSHSKGVKGIPVRLCAKTEMVPSNTESPSENLAEVCYCQVKLFRDHGAERKLSNDVSHVKKSIEKLRQQIAQAEMGAGNYGKRKRGNAPLTLKNPDPRPTKITKHKRTWSMCSQDGSERMSIEDDLRAKLAAMQEMFTSTAPVSILALRGDDEDDPDLFPIELPEARSFVKKDSVSKARSSGGGTPSSSQGLSPTTSAMSLNSPVTALQRPSSVFYDSGYAGNASSENSRPGSGVLGETPLWNHPVKIQKPASGEINGPVGYIEAVDIDPTYRPPAEQRPKPIACFYIRFPRNDQDDYYRAVYLTERTVRDLIEKISKKQQRLDPQRIVRVLRIHQNGLKIMVDDDVVRELPEGQDMVVEFSEARPFEDSSPSPGGPSPAVEVKLSY